MVQVPRVGPRRLARQIQQILEARVVLRLEPLQVEDRRRVARERAEFVRERQLRGLRGHRIFKPTST